MLRLTDVGTSLCDVSPTEMFGRLNVPKARPYRGYSLNVRELLGVTHLGQDVVGDVDGGGGEDYRAGRGAVKDGLQATFLSQLLDGVVDVVLNGLEQSLTLFVEFAFRAEVGIAQLSGLGFLVDDFLLALLGLLLGEEYLVGQV